MKQKFTYWTESDGKHLGYLNDYPDHWTQGDNLEDLKEHISDLYKEFRKGDLPSIKKVEEIEIG
jgi:predicted RNase H-like HicB family nuclease